MKEALKIGITGGIGSGKTTVCKAFEAMGVDVYYADDRAKFLMNNDVGIKTALKKLFGADIADENERPNRKAIAAAVFADKKLLRKLNEIIHPKVKEDWIQWYDTKKSKVPYVLKEAALLFESGSYKTLDSVICVTAPKSLRIERVMKRDGVSAEEVCARMENQLSEELKVSLSDHIIINDGKHSLVKQVVLLHRQMTIVRDSMQ